LDKGSGEASGDSLVSSQRSSDGRADESSEHCKVDVEDKWKEEEEERKKKKEVKALLFLWGNKV
jgi:hypothetical protein